MDTSGNVEDISFVLSKKNGDKLGNITNIDNIVTKHFMKEASEFTFTAHKKIGDNIIRCWNDIKDFKLVWIPEWDMWYEITVEVNEKDENVKNVSGKTLGEAELSQIMLYGIEINTETDIAREEYKIPTTFYNPDHPEASLMDRLLTDKAPHYKIKHIDKSLMNLQRTFTFDDTSIYDALQEVSEELDCLFIFGCGSDENGKPERTISAYDLEANCVDCGNRDTFVHKCPKCGSTNIILGYGEYTNVFISRDNLVDEITYSVDTDSVKNCMKLEAGDDLMTAAIRSCNPNGTDYIYYFPDETREEMSPELQEKLKSYDALYEKYQSDYNFTINDSFVTNYNALVNKYKTYEENLKDTEIKNPIVGYPKLMRIYFDTIDMVQLLRNKLMPPVDKPDNNAKSQGEYLMANLPSSASTTSLKNLSVSTADNIMVMLAQSIVKGVFKVTVTNTTLSNNVWKGKFNLENYSDKDDTFTSQFVSISINENYESYVKQRIDSILARSDENYYDIVGLFKQDMTVFKSQLKKYCLNTLQIFQKCCQSCIDMMVQQGISSNSTSSIYGINTKVLYENVYVPYYNKMNAIQDEIKVREDELYTVEGKYNNQNQLVQDGIQIEIERIITEVQDALNFKNYIGIDLYKEFSSFIRMDKYSNDNYISDGLNNTDLMKNAIEFITVATKELYKSATLQHSITGTIKNFLRMKEFEPVTNNFKNGNWICVGIDDKIYQLRIIEYEIDFSDTQNISVTFSDVVSTPDGMTDLESILSNSSKMATSYSGVVRQSTINTNFKNKMNEMIAKGLSMTNTKIVSNADNQDITWDEHGLLCREYDDIISDYTDSQLKIINHGIYITDDNWKTARAGIGNFIYYDPKDQTYKESYGVIADTLVSNLILTSEVGIYNEEKSIEMAKDGIIVTTNTMNKNVFTIRKEITDDEGNITYERQLYIDDNGNIRLAGNASIAWDSITGTENVVVKDTLDDLLSNLNKELSEKIINLEEQTDQKAETWYQSSDPSSQWTTEKDKKNHKGDIWYDTKNQVTKIYNGNSWEYTKTTPPDEVFDKIDGKAAIYISQPNPPYNVGDLWFNGITSDILTCVKKRIFGDTFNLSDWQKRNKYTDNSELTNFVNNTYTKRIAELQSQVDGKIETFFYDYEPALNNIPASQWTDNDQKKEHVGDLFYWKSKGYTYCFIQDGSTWKWQLVQDADIDHAMKAAEKAQDTADGKRRVFVSQPKPPYDIGDLWTQGTSGDLMKCKVSRLSGNYNVNDWEKATKYTDDSSLNTFINGDYATSLKNIKNQVDGKADTWYQETDPSSAWKTTDDKKKHVGDLWYDTKNQKTYIYGAKGWEETKTTPPDSVFNTINKKAQIFVEQPKPPYNVGDLWVNGIDILTCVNPRTSGIYTSSDWAKKNTYTDDSFAKQVQQNLNNLKIGGRNFLSKTSKASSITTSYNNATTGFSAIDIYGTIGCNNNKQNGKTLADLGCQIGDECTISFDYNVSQNSSKTLVLGTYVLEMRLNSTYVYTVSSRMQLQSSGRVNISFKIANENQLKVNNLCVRIDNSTCVFTVSNAKLEKGNKATDWTPAPEDTESYVDNLASDLQEQIDGKIETFNQTSDPSSTWTTANIKTQHKGDIWYNPNTKITQRYSGTTWETLYNKEAQEASTLAQKKAQVFVSTPTIPYYKGDLWFGGATGDIKTCTNTRVSGSYTASDWAKYNKYTDDSSLTTFIKDTYTTDVADIRDQIDGKIETFRQDSDPSSAWKTDDVKKQHKGDIWYDTKNQKSYIYVNSSWSELKTTPPDTVFSSINSKAQIFVKQPTIPYQVGDLWFNGTDILTCVVSRTSGSYIVSDWAKKNTYTDDSFAKKVQENLNNLQIGGRNLVLNSYKLDGKWSAAGGYVGTTTVVQDSSALSKYHIESKCTTAGNGAHYPVFPKTSDKIGKTYTWSFEAKCSVAKTGIVGHECGGQTTISVTTEWKKFSHTWKFTDNQYNSFTFYLGFKVGEILYIRDFKIEEGSKATSWTPAPEDTETYADNLAADLKTQIDGKIETFNQTIDPSASWTSAQKVSHKGDIWYNSSTKETKRYNGSTWDTLQNKEAQEASSLAQKKAQVFTVTPTIPYYKGDLWFGGTGSDIKTCTVTRTSGNYIESDWAKYNKYTDDSTANTVKNNLTNLSQVLGYDGTKLTGTYIYSPHIIGGELSIGDPNGIHASITTDGKLTATGAEITGAITATSGSFTGTVNANAGTFTNVDIQSGKIGGLTLASNSIKSSNGNFSVTSGGKLTATDAIITGNITATSGSFTGAITATSLTLGSGVSIGASKVSGLSNVATSGDYNDLDNKPEIPNVTYYIRKDGTVGAEPSEGSTGFKVSSDGLLQASNAIIYGEIVASSGKIGGFNISTKADKSHYYTNTLYRITTDNTYYYQAGISSDGTSPTNATFYVRRSNYSNDWNNSIVPFFVRNNGSLYAQDATVGTALYICEDSTKYSSRIPILAYDKKGDAADYQLTLGLLNSSSRISFDTQSVNFESFYGYEMMSVVSYDGTSAWLWKGDRCKTLDIGTSGRSFDNGYFKKLYLDGTDIETLIKTGSTPTGLKKNKIRIGSSDNGQGMGGGKEYVVYSDSTWSDTLPITCYTIGAASSNHSHDMSSYATTSWVKGAFGNTLSISGSTLYLKNYNGSQLSSVTLPPSSGGSSTPSEAIASDGTTRPIVTSGTAGSNTYTAWIGTYYESSSYVLKVNGRWGSSSWETHGFKSNYSDIRLKTNISNSNRKALDIINSIKLRQFDWIRSGEHQDIGFIADELETLDKHFVFGGGYEEDGSMNIKSVDSLYLQGYEVKAIQELSQENQRLKNTILSLQGEIAIIKQKLEELA